MLDLIERVAARRRDARGRPARPGDRAAAAAGRAPRLGIGRGEPPAAAPRVAVGDHEAVGAGAAGRRRPARTSEAAARRGRAPAATRSSSWSRPAAADARATRHPRRARRRCRPPCRRGRGAARRLPRDAARLSRGACPSTCTRSTWTRRSSWPTCGVEGMDELVDAEIVVRDEGASGPARVAVPPRDAARRRVREPAEARARSTLHLSDRRAPRGERPSSRTPPSIWRRRAGVDRHRPDRPATARARGRRAGRRRATAAGAGWRAARRIDYYERALAMAGPTSDGACARRACWRAWASRTTGSASTRRRSSVLDRAVVLGTRTGRRLDARARAAVPRRHRDQRRGGHATGGGAARTTLARRGRAARRAVGAGAARSCSSGGCRGRASEYEDADAMWRRALADRARARRPLGGGARAHVAVDQRRQHRRPTTRPRRLIEEAQAAGRGDRRPVQRRRGDRRSAARLLEDARAVRGGAAGPRSGDRRSSPSSARAGSWPTRSAERGIAKRELGQLDEAEDDLRRTARISEELGERQLASWTWRALARVSEKRGDLGRGRGAVPPRRRGRRPQAADEPPTAGRTA